MEGGGRGEFAPCMPRVGWHCAPGSSYQLTATSRIIRVQSMALVSSSLAKVFEMDPGT